VNIFDICADISNFAHRKQHNKFNEVEIPRKSNESNTAMAKLCNLEPVPCTGGALMNQHKRILEDPLLAKCQ
jgi:hypothetical protein